LAANWRSAWVILPYAAVFLGMLSLRSAWGALIGFHLALAPLLLQKQTLTHPLLSPVSLRMLIPIALAGMLGGLGLWIIWPWAGIPSDFQTRVAVLGLSGTIWLPFIVYFTLINPFLEELYWRGALGNDRRRPMLVDFLYAGYHTIILALFVDFEWVLFGFLILSATGWLWRQVTRYTDSLLPSVLSHMLADFAILMVLYLKAL
jgi:membrane protease YdiL (CAAX protease family)